MKSELRLDWFFVVSFGLVLGCSASDDLAAEVTPPDRAPTPGVAEDAPSVDDSAPTVSGSTDSGATDAGSADAGPVRPPTPTVKAVTGFVRVFDDAPIKTIRCTTKSCLLTYLQGANPVAAYELPTGAAKVNALPNGPRFTSVAGVGGEIFGSIHQYRSGNDWPQHVYKLTGATWTRVGNELPSVNVFEGQLTTDGKRLYVTSSTMNSGSVMTIPVGAGPNDTWTAVGSAVPAYVFDPSVDFSGNVVVRTTTSVWRLPKGGAAFEDIGFGGHPTVAPNDDVWSVHWVSFVTPAGKIGVFAAAGSWTEIKLPAAAATNPSRIVVDGGGTAWFTAAMPARLFKIPKGAGTAIDTGVVIGGGGCGPTGPALDGDGRLIVACQLGLYRSVP